MKVTTEFLKRINSCQESIDFLEKNFGGEAEPLEIIEKFPNIPIDWIHDARRYLLETPEEIKKYNELCRIINSHMAIYGTDISNSTYVFKSNNVKDSNYIRQSTNIENSAYIYNSHNVYNSNNISHSVEVKDSTLVIQSSNICDSLQVSTSEYINWSKYINYSFDINECNFIYSSKHLLKCDFCSFLQNCDHCAFCTGLHDKSYYIFNKSVTISEYTKFYTELEELLVGETISFMTAKQGDYFNITYSGYLPTIFNGLSDDFYDWLYQTPYFDEDVFMNLFFKQREEKI